MKANADYHDYIMDLLTPIANITSKAMFGGYGIFHEGIMFALISGSSIYFKVEDTNRTAYEKSGSKQFKPMPYWVVPVEVIENTEKLHEWAYTSIAIGHATAKKKRRK